MLRHVVSYTNYEDLVLSDEYKKLCSCPFINESKNLSHKMESKGFFDSNHTFSDITKILNPEWADYPQRIRHTSLISECIRT